MTIPSRRRALLIHVEHYEDARFAPLPSAHEGAEELAEALRETAGVEVTVCADLTFGALRGAVARFCADREPDEFALLYLACRSAVAPSGEVVLAATDTDPHRLAETGLTTGALAACLEECWAEQKVAVLDCPDPTRSGNAALPAPPGVYLLAGDPAADSAEVAAAMAEALRAGAGRRAVVTADDLSDAVQLALGAAHPPRAATVSAVRADGRIPVAAPPLPGGRPLPPAPDRRPTRAPDHQELLAYYRDVVRAGTGGLPLIEPAGPGHVLVHGRERVLLDDVDDDGCLPLPRGAEHLVADLRDDRTLWAGWPTVVLHPPPGERWPGPLCAPLFVRRLEVADGEDGQRLRPLGPPVPHLGLAHLRLGAEEATTLISSWVAGWRRGEASRLAADADRLLRDELGLLCLERLSPELLGTRLNTHSPLDGARNVAVLFTAAPAPAVADLLADLDAIARTPQALAGTALAALLPGGPAPEPADAPVAAVTPQALTATQQAVLHSVLTEPLTAVTGAAGTGKTRLVVDVVATAVAAGQSVLVAARTDRAVDEVVDRCRRVLPGLLMRIGRRDRLGAGDDAEAGALDELLARNAPRRSAETRRLGFRYAEHLVALAEQGLRAVAEQETELLALGRARSAAYGRLGHTAEELTQRLGPNWGERARELADVRAFGEVRRRRFLGDTELPPGPGRTAETCLALAELDELDRRWRHACETARDAVPDADLQVALTDANRRMEQASREVLAGVVLDGVDRGRAALAELRSVRRRGSPDRAAFHHALPHLRGWAVTALSARRLPTRPGLFDLVVIDEAQHCPLPEAVPLLFRARRALVIGDPEQLPHVDAVPARTDAVLRDRHAVARDWLGRHRLSPVRHSVLAAAERAAGGAAVLDEHYRSHPAIAELGNRLGPPRPLHVLTDIGRSPLPVRRAVMWRNIAGRAERGPDRTSWRNRAEAEETNRCARRLLERLPAAGTVGVVTPYRPQAEALAGLLADEPRVTVGTPSAFQGHEHEAMVLSMVADGTDHRFDRAQRQRELWTVALSRARYLLVVVGNEAVWTARGGFGAALVAAARRATDLGKAVGDDLADRLDQLLSDVPGTAFEVAVRGHPADALLSDGGQHRPVLIDRGAERGTDPAVHLARMLRLLDVLGGAAVRLPGWLLHDSPDAARTRIVV